MTAIGQHAGSARRLLTVALLLMLALPLAAQITHDEASDAVKDCGTTAQARELARLIMHSDRQRHPRLRCHAVLAQLAQQKAMALAQANHISHTVNHEFPNQQLLRAGLKLPVTYPVIGNQVESILGGGKTPLHAFKLFMGSPLHKAHLMGETPFLQKQDWLGVGYYHDPAGRHEDYWVVYLTELKP